MENNIIFAPLVLNTNSQQLRQLSLNKETISLLNNQPSNDARPTIIFCLSLGNCTTQSCNTFICIPISRRLRHCIGGEDL